MPFNYKHLYYFWATAHEGSLTAAAQRLHLTPQTICGQLQALEERLNAELFRRQGRNLVLTEMGKTVWRYADEIFSLGRELAEEVHRQTVAHQQHFVVGLTEFLPKLIAYQLLRPVYTLSEELRIHCHEDRLEKLLGDLAAHKLDLVLSDRSLPEDAPVRACDRLLGKSGVSFFSAPELADVYTRDFPAGLDGAPMLMMAPDTPLRGHLQQWFEELGVQPRVVGEFDDSALLKVFGQAGVGIFCAPTILEKEIAAQYQVKVIGRTDQVRVHFYAIYHERRSDHPAVLAICREQLEDEQRFAVADYWSNTSCK
ncbi:MAG: transcriptional activator NhaR [Methylothermaceae bacterium]|nr:transcriptional activator NhaR [Methylothermaceae bacterium]